MADNSTISFMDDLQKIVALYESGSELVVCARYTAEAALIEVSRLRSEVEFLKARPFDTPCNCCRTCGDVSDEIGVCKGLEVPPEPPLIEFTVVHRGY